MPEEDNSDVDIAGEVDLTAEGSVKRPDTSVQQDQIGQETSTIAIVASEEGKLIFEFSEEQSMQKWKTASSESKHSIYQGVRNSTFVTHWNLRDAK